MGSMQEKLANILSIRAKTSSIRPGRLSRADLLGSGIADEVYTVYRNLGGILDEPPVNPRSTWDMELDGYIIELDEQLHFNRYRKISLQSSLYANLKSFPMREFDEFCELHETDCYQAGKYGRKWTTGGSEKQFGLSPQQGQLIGLGPARWRQRAYYDFLKDVCYLINGTRVARLSIWDSVHCSSNSLTVKQLLSGNESTFSDALWKIIQTRTPPPQRHQ